MTLLNDYDLAQSTEFPDDGFVDATLNRLLDVYSGHGYDQGYTRATRDLLAIYPLLIEQFLHQRREATPQVRRLVREFGRFVEDHVGRKLTDAGLVDGAGI